MRPRGDSPGLGLGLPTIAQLTTSFDIRDGPGGRGTEVHMVFDVPGVRAPVQAADQDAWRYELLAEVTRLTGTGWPGEGVERLLDLLVPAIADACSIDLVEADGPRRVAARVDDDPDGSLTPWLAGRRPPDEALQEIMPALRHGEVHVVPLSEEVNRGLASLPGDLERMTHVDLAWWVSVPLTESDVLLGTLGLGLKAARADPAGELPFFGALGERAARGLASTHLVDELRRTRRRLERILSALSEAVTVQDGLGRMVYANAAATDLLGAASVQEILSAEAGALAARFHITREDGTPVALADLPGYRVLAGAETASLLTRSVTRATGVERWLLTKATLLEDGEPFAVNIIEDITEAKNADLRRRLLAQVGELLARPDPASALPGIAVLAVPALADWCAIDLGAERVAEAGEVDERRTEFTAPIGTAGALHLATAAGARALGEDHRQFAVQLAARLGAGLAG
jgi:PAS domain-containing protein